MRMTKVKKLVDFLERAQRTVGTLFLIALLITVSLQIISRFVIKSPIRWTEEGARFLFFWVALMGASVSVHGRRHFTIEVYDPKKIKTPWLRLLLEIVPEIIVLAFCLLLTYYGWLYFESGKTRLGIEVPLSMSLVYLALPISGISMMVYTVANIFNLIKTIYGSSGNFGTND